MKITLAAQWNADRRGKNGGRESAQGEGIVTWRGAEDGSLKDPTPRGRTSIREGEENQKGVYTQKPTEELFTNKPVATGGCKNNIKQGH